MEKSRILDEYCQLRWILSEGKAMTYIMELLTLVVTKGCGSMVFDSVQFRGMWTG